MATPDLVPLQIRGTRVAAGEVIAITEAEFRPRQMAWLTTA